MLLMLHSFASASLSTLLHHPTLMGMTSGFEDWLPGVSLVLVVESFLVAMRFVHGLRLREMPCFKGFDGSSILFC
jgi:hypothetical protein